MAVADRRECGVHCKFWSRKEIENFLFVPEAIARAIRDDSSRSTLSSEDVAEILKRCADDEFELVVAQRQAEELRYRRLKRENIHAASINQAVLRDVRSRWESEWQIFVPGKKVLASMRTEMEGRKARPPSAARIIGAMSPSQAPAEVTAFLNEIVSGIRFGRMKSKRRPR